MARKPISEGLPTLKSFWKTGEDFLERLDLTARETRLSQPVDAEGPAAAANGSILLLQITFEDRKLDFNIHARVVQQRRNELLLAFVPEEQRALDLVLTGARGESLPYFRRRHPRIPVNLPVVLELLKHGQQHGRREETTVLSISEGGARLALTACKPPENAAVQLTMCFPSGPRITVRGRVSYVAAASPRPSIGVEFRFRSAIERDALSNQVRGLPAKAK